MIGKMFRILDTEAPGSIGYDFLKSHKDRWEDLSFEESSIDLSVMAAPRVVANDEKYGPTVYKIIKQYFIAEGSDTIRLVVLEPILQENENPLMTRMHNGSARYAKGFIPGFTDTRLDKDGNIMKDKDGNPIHKDTVKRIDESELVKPPTPEDPEELPEDAITLFTISAENQEITATNKKGESRTLQAEELLYGPLYVEKIVSATKAMGGYSLNNITIGCGVGDLEHVVVDGDTSVSLSGKTGAQHAIIELSRLLQQYMKRKTPEEKGSGLTSILVPAFRLFHASGKVTIKNTTVPEAYYTNLPKVMDFHGLKILQAVADDLEISSTIVKSVEITTGSSIAVVVLGNGVKIKSDISKVNSDSDNIVHILEDYIEKVTTKEDDSRYRVKNPSFRVWENGDVDVIADDGSSTIFHRAELPDELVAEGAALFTEAVKEGYIGYYDGTRAWGAWNVTDNFFWVGMKNNVINATWAAGYKENITYKTVVDEYYADLMDWVENPPVDTQGFETSFSLNLSKNMVSIGSDVFMIEGLPRSLKVKIQNITTRVLGTYGKKEKTYDIFAYDATKENEGVIGYYEGLKPAFAVHPVKAQISNLIQAIYQELLDYNRNMSRVIDLTFDLKGGKIAAQVDNRTITAAMSMEYTNMEDLFTMMVNLTNNFLAHFSIDGTLDKIEFSSEGAYFEYTIGDSREEVSFQDWADGISQVKTALEAMKAWIPEKNEPAPPDTFHADLIDDELSIVSVQPEKILAISSLSNDTVSMIDELRTIVKSAEGVTDFPVDQIHYDATTATARCVDVSNNHIDVDLSAHANKITTLLNRIKNYEFVDHKTQGLGIELDGNGVVLSVTHMSGGNLCTHTLDELTAPTKALMNEILGTLETGATYLCFSGMILKHYRYDYLLRQERITDEDFKLTINRFESLLYSDCISKTFNPDAVPSYEIKETSIKIYVKGVRSEIPFTNLPDDLVQASTNLFQAIKNSGLGLETTAGMFTEYVQTEAGIYNFMSFYPEIKEAYAEFKRTLTPFLADLSKSVDLYISLTANTVTGTLEDGTVKRVTEETTVGATNAAEFFTTMQNFAQQKVSTYCAAHEDETTGVSISIEGKTFHFHASTGGDEIGWHNYRSETDGSIAAEVSAIYETFVNYTPDIPEN